MNWEYTGTTYYDLVDIVAVNPDDETETVSLGTNINIYNRSFPITIPSTYSGLKAIIRVQRIATAQVMASGSTQIYIGTTPPCPRSGFSGADCQTPPTLTAVRVVDHEDDIASLEEIRPGDDFRVEFKYQGAGAVLQ